MAENIQQKKLERSRVSAAALVEPIHEGGRIQRGILILNQVDQVLDAYPELADLFIIVERHGWFGPLLSQRADIKLVEDLEVYDLTESLFPNAVLLKIGPADFVDHEAFRPLGYDCDYDGIQISCWSERKRIELFIEAAGRLPHRRFVHLGHFENGGTEQERDYRDSCIELAARTARNIDFPVARISRNADLPQKENQINEWINRSRIGILTATSEGINRFKMECLAANRPMLAPDDVAWPTRKHINIQTGEFFQPNADDLSRGIENALSKLESYAPRKYVLSNTGKEISLRMLRSALATVCAQSGDRFRFDGVDWNGRNNTLYWGHAACEYLEKIVERYRHLLCHGNEIQRLGQGLCRKAA